MKTRPLLIAGVLATLGLAGSAVPASAQSQDDLIGTVINAVAAVAGDDRCDGYWIEGRCYRDRYGRYPYGDSRYPSYDRYRDDDRHDYRGRWIEGRYYEGRGYYRDGRFWRNHREWRSHQNRYRRDWRDDRRREYRYERRWNRDD